MKIYGSWLAYQITLRASGVTLGAALMDNPEGRWDLLLRTTDGRAGVGYRPSPCREPRAQRGQKLTAAD